MKVVLSGLFYYNKESETNWPWKEKQFILLRVWGRQAVVFGDEFLTDWECRQQVASMEHACVLSSSSFEATGIQSWGSALRTFFNSSHFLISLTSKHHLWDNLLYFSSFTVVIKCQHMVPWGTLRPFPNHSSLTSKRRIRTISENGFHEKPWDAL